MRLSQGRDGAAGALLEEMVRRLAFPRRLGAADRAALEKTITYFGHHLKRMDYAACAAVGLAIGSDVTDAGCRLLIKKCLCVPGMTWGFTHAGPILSQVRACQQRRRPPVSPIAPSLLNSHDLETGPCGRRRAACR